MRNKELFNELYELCEKYGFEGVKQNLKSLGLREFEKDNHPTIGEKLSETIDDIVNLQRLRKRHLFEYDWNKRDCELEDDFNEPLHYFTKEIKENRMKVLDVIMD